jgi:hypothetical protein
MDTFNGIRLTISACFCRGLSKPPSESLRYSASCFNPSSCGRHSMMAVPGVHAHAHKPQKLQQRSSLPRKEGHAVLKFWTCLLDAMFTVGEMMRLNSRRAMTEGQTPYVAESVVIAARAMRSFATEAWFTGR